VVALHILEALAYISAAVVAPLVWWQIRCVKKQATTSFEDSLTDHYRRIIENIAIEIWLGPDLDTLELEPKKRCREAIYRYIDLCQDQVFLHDNGRITDATWAEWGPGIKGNMSIAAFKEVLNEVQAKLPNSFSEPRKFLSTQQFPCLKPCSNDATTALPNTLQLDRKRTIIRSQLIGLFRWA